MKGEAAEAVAVGGWTDVGAIEVRVEGAMNIGGLGGREP